MAYTISDRKASKGATNTLARMTQPWDKGSSKDGNTPTSRHLVVENAGAMRQAKAL
jgi:hypothetical protein